jgi:hypothetical protein
VERGLFQLCESIHDVEHQQRAIDRGYWVRFQFNVEQPFYTNQDSLNSDGTDRRGFLNIIGARSIR